DVGDAAVRTDCVSFEMGEPLKVCHQAVDPLAFFMKTLETCDIGLPDPVDERFQMALQGSQGGTELVCHIRCQAPAQSLLIPKSPRQIVYGGGDPVQLPHACLLTNDNVTVALRNALSGPCDAGEGDCNAPCRDGADEYRDSHCAERHPKQEEVEGVDERKLLVVQEEGTVIADCCHADIREARSDREDVLSVGAAPVRVAAGHVVRHVCNHLYAQTVVVHGGIPHRLSV